MRSARPTVPILASLVAAACCACATQVPRFPLAPDDPRPYARLASWDEAARQRTGLRARAKLTVDAADTSLRANQVLVLERPRRLRVEVLGFLGQSVAVLVINDGRFEFFDAESRAYESGEVHDGLLWQYARIDLTPAEAIDLLLGAPVLDRTLRPIRATATAGGAIQTDLVDERDVVRERIGFDPVGRLTDFEARDTLGELEWRARFLDYAEVEGSAVAHKIVLEVREGDSRAEILLSDVELGPDVPSGLFQLRAP